jgi:hypothetical protein
MPAWVYTIADVVHGVLPRYKDLDVVVTRGVQRDLLPTGNFERRATEKLYESFKGWESFGVTTFWIATMLGLACWRFSTKDY